MRSLQAVLLGLGLTLAFSTGALALEATAVMEGTGGDVLGTVTLTETPHGVLLRAELTGIPRAATAFTSTRRVPARPISRRPAVTSTRRARDMASTT